MTSETVKIELLESWNQVNISSFQFDSTTKRNEEKEKRKWNEEGEASSSPSYIIGYDGMQALSSSAVVVFSPIVLKLDTPSVAS